MELINNVAKAHGVYMLVVLLLHPPISSNMAAGGFSVFAGVGERTREGNDLYKEMVESVASLFLLFVIYIIATNCCSRLS